MQPPVETVRVSEQARDQLIKLKRLTKIKNWNVLCRWAFCFSLAEDLVPTDRQVSGDSNIEMTWKVFGGRHERVYQALLRERCHQDGLPLDQETLAHQFRLHLHRGIAYLSASKHVGSLPDLCHLAIDRSTFAHAKARDQSP